jgi:hypothetical protein
MFPRIKQIVSLAVLFAAVSAHADPLVYVTNLFQQFGTLNLATGQFQTIGPGLSEAGAGLVPGAAGSLLTLTVSGNLDSINTTTGINTTIGATGLGGNANTLATVGGVLYATDLANNLYSVNTSTGATTLIGPTGIPAVPAYPFSVNSDGTLNLFDESFYGVGSKLYATFDAFRLGVDNFTVSPVVSPNLWEIDPFTGLASIVATTDLQLLSSVEIGGTFYALHGSFLEDGSFNNVTQITSLDLATGKTTSLVTADAAAGPIFGMSPVVSSVPEPSSLALLGTGLMALAARLRRR